MVAKVTDSEFKYDFDWAKKIEAKLAEVCECSLICLLNLQGREIDTDIDPSLKGSIFSNSPSKGEIAATAEKAVLIFFARQAKYVATILDHKNEDIEDFRKHLLGKGDMDTLPSKFAERILSSYDHTFKFTMGKLDEKDYNLIFLHAHKSKYAGWQAELPECVQRMWDIKTPLEQAKEEALLYTKLRVRAHDILSNQKLMESQLKSAQIAVIELENRAQTAESRVIKVEAKVVKRDQIIVDLRAIING